MKGFYTTDDVILNPKQPAREEGDGKEPVAVETLGSIVIKGDEGDPDNHSPDVTQYWFACPDDMDIDDLMDMEGFTVDAEGNKLKDDDGEEIAQVPTVFPDAETIATNRGKLMKHQFVNRKVQEKIREKYTVEEELKALRTGDTDHADYVAACIAEGNVEKKKFGLKE